MDEHLSTTMNIQEDHQQVQHRKQKFTRLSLQITAKVHEAILADHRQTIHDVCEMVGLSYGYRSAYFDGQFEHEKHFCKICVKTAEQQSEGPSHFCLQGSQTTSQR
jgi:hypothetical protein